MNITGGSGYSGYSGCSGYSGIGYSGYSGISGYSGYSGHQTPQGVAVANASAGDIVTKFNVLLTSLRNAGVIAT